MPDITRLFRGDDRLMVEIVEATAGEQSPLETHDFNEIIVLVRGRADILIYGVTMRERAPAFTTVGPGVAHQVTAVTDITVVVIHDRRE